MIAILHCPENEDLMKNQKRREKQLFCTQCGSDLEDFWLYHKTEGYADVLKSHFECQRTGKFKGSMCSKLFIADTSVPKAARKKSNLSRADLARLKKSVLQRIDADTTSRKK
jgi:hypothetical protein